MKITVHGPPGAGNRLVGRILDAAPHDWDVTVMHLPGKWFDADFYVFTSRDLDGLMASILKEGMVHTEHEAMKMISAAHRQVREHFERELRPEDFTFARLNDLATDGPGPLINKLAEKLNVMPWVFTEEIYDPNEKYGLTPPF